MGITLLEVGDKAPLFKLKNQDGKEVALKDYLGKRVVIYFYPKALTPGCTTQACGIRDSKDQLKKRKAHVFGISPDKVEKLKKFEETHDLNFDLLADEGHKVADAYGVWGLKKMMGRTYDGVHRVTYVIDKGGHIEHVIAKVKTATHHDDVLELLA